MSTVVQVSEICIKKGLSANLPDALNEAELAFTTDNGQVFVGAPNLSDLDWRRQGQTYAQYPYGNLRLLTELDVGKMISGDVALNVPIQSFNLPTTNNVTIDISTTSTANDVAVSATNPMPMYYLPPSANTAKMDVSIVNGTTGEIDIATLYISAYTLTGATEMTVAIRTVGNIPTGLTFYGSTDNINRVVNANAATNGYAEQTYDLSESESSLTISDVQIKLGYVNTNDVTYTVYASMACWESSSSSSAPTPGLSGIIAVSSAYSNANVIYPKGEKGDTGAAGTSFPNDGSTPVDASTVTATSGNFTSLDANSLIAGLNKSFQIFSIDDQSSLNASQLNVYNNIESNLLQISTATVLPGGDLVVVDAPMTIMEEIYFNNGAAGYYNGEKNLLLFMEVDITNGGSITMGAGTSFMVENNTGIQFQSVSTTGTNYYQLAVDSSGRLNLTSPSGGSLYTAGDVTLAGKTTIDNLSIQYLDTSYIELESAKLVKTTSLVNNMSQTSTVVSGTGGLIGWNLVNDDTSLYFINMLGGYNSNGFKFITYGGENTVGVDANDYDVMFDSSGNISAKGGLTLGNGSNIVLNDSSGTGTITMGYNTTDQAVVISESGIAVGAFIFPDNVTAKSFTTTGSLAISDYSGNIPSTKWVKNYVESTKVDFSNDGSSDLYANNGSFSSLQVTGLTTLENVTAVTPVVGDDSNNVATTSFVNSSMENYLNNVALTDYMTTATATATFVSGKYGMATTDYSVQGLYYSNEVDAPIVVYTDTNGGINQLTMVDTIFASNNFVSQTQLTSLFPNDGTSAGSFLSLSSKSLTVTGTSQFNIVTAKTPSLTDTSNNVATCSFVSQQNYISGSYNVTGISTVYYGKGLYYDISTASPTFTYLDSSSTLNKSLLVTQTFLNANYVSQSSLTSALSAYAKTTQLSSYVNAAYLQQNYIPLTSQSLFLTVSNAAATYATLADLSDYATISSINNNYVTVEDFNNEIADYVKTSTLTNTLNNYATVSNLSNYVTTSSLTNTLTGYVTLAQFNKQNPTTPVTLTDVQTYLTENSYITSSSLTGYLTTSAAASTYLTQTKFNTTIANYSTTSQITNTFVTGLSSSTSYDSVTSVYYDPTNDVITMNYESTDGKTTGEYNAISKTYVDGKFVTKATILPSSYAAWSAQVNFGGVAATIQVNQSGYYIMGCICYIWLDATITSMGTGTGSMTITSLPTNATGTFAFPLNISISKIYSTTISASVSNTVINVYGSNANTITNSNVYVGSEIVISGSYPIYLGS